MAEIVYRVTIKGDCGLEHQSLQDWGNCSACHAILQGRYRRTDLAMRAALYPYRGARDETDERLVRWCGD